ncbi:MAG TPA: fibronectin type III domain-containing protein [Clostridia bacterium]|nr:fibronectin type III domain-containing protein [Clostridia bacterium]
MKELKGFFCLALLISLFAAISLKAAAADKIKMEDTQRPVAPKELLVTGKTCTSVSLSWSGASDNVRVKGYYVYRDGKKIITTSETNYKNSELVPGRKYTFEVKAYDAAGNISTNSSWAAAFTDSDTQPPTIPGSLSVSARDNTSVTVSWSPSTDNTGLKGYVVYKNGGRVASTTGTGYTVKRLLPGTTYTFFVKAYDKTGNYSDQSCSVQGMTLPDTKAPDRPFGLKGTSVTGTQITLMWSPSPDNVKVKRYEVYCDGEKKGSPAKTVFTSRNLVPGKNYKYTVVAVDTAGNRSAASDPIVIRTLKDDQKPSTPTGLKIIKKRGSSVSLEWTASSDNIKVVGYIVYCNGSEIEKSKKASRTVTNKSKPIIGIYWVKAYDLSGNLSDASNKVTVISP